ncbi:hypothetical protein BU17DRAFT_71544 [Hysterangium stoloniferum]|nr:hypothetical protein BU17DRAFT_71544 [Hysterangium stoloniferum]
MNQASVSPNHKIPKRKAKDNDNIPMTIDPNFEFTFDDGMPETLAREDSEFRYMVDDNEGGGETEGEVDYEQPSVVVDVVSHAAEAEIARLKHELAMANAQNEFQSHSMSRQPSISINEAPLPPGVPKTGPVAGKKRSAVLSEPYNVLVAHKKKKMTSKKLPTVNFLQQHAAQQAAATKSITISTTTSAPFSAPISASAPVSASISALTSTSALASTSDSASTSTTISHESSLSLSAGTGLIANPAEGVRADQLRAYTPNHKRFFNHTKRYIHLFLATQDAFPTIEVSENFIVNAVRFANTDMGVDVKISTDIRKMLKNEMSKVRNRWKAAAMKVVRDEYGLSGTHEQIKARATFILQDFRYVYIRSDSPELEYRRERPFEHTCIANVVKMCAFTHHQSIARLKETALKPVPAQVIALATIVIHNAVAQWRETGKLKNISLEDKNGYCAKYRKILEHLDIVRTGRPTYFSALQTSLYQQGMATLGITIQRAGSDDDHFTIGDDITPDSAISPSMSPLQVPITRSKRLLYQAATRDNGDQSDSEHWESPTSDMDAGDDSDNGSVIPTDDLDA